MARRKRLVIPRAATLRGRRFRVYRRKTLEMNERKLVGLCDLDAHTIHLDPLQDPHELDATWVHEVLHAIWPRGLVDDETEEKLIRGLEYRLRDAVARGYLRAAE